MTEVIQNEERFESNKVIRAGSHQIKKYGLKINRAH